MMALMVVMEMLNHDERKKTLIDMARHEPAFFSLRMFNKKLSDFQENFVTLNSFNDLYLKPTQVGELNIRRGARKLSLRNSAK